MRDSYILESTLSCKHALDFMNHPISAQQAEPKQLCPRRRRKADYIPLSFDFNSPSHSAGRYHLVHSRLTFTILLLNPDTEMTLFTSLHLGLQGSAGGGAALSNQLPFLGHSSYSFC